MTLLENIVKALDIHTYNKVMLQRHYNFDITLQNNAETGLIAVTLL